MSYEPVAPGVRGEQYAAGIVPPIFYLWQFDADSFTARQEVDREEIYGVNGDPSADSYSRPKTILSGDLKMKVGPTTTAQPPNIGEYAQIKGGDTNQFKDAGGTYWWVLCTASEVSQYINGKVSRCRVEFEFRPAIHDDIVDSDITVTDVDIVLT